MRRKVRLARTSWFLLLLWGGQEANTTPKELFPARRTGACRFGLRYRGELGPADPAVAVAVDPQPAGAQGLRAGELAAAQVAVPVLVQPVEQRLAGRGVPPEARARRGGSAGGAFFLRCGRLFLRKSRGKGKKQQGGEQSHGARG